MTPRLIRVTAKELLRLLANHGYRVVRSKGSHHHLVHPVSNLRLTVPVHAGKIIGPGLLRSILKQAQIPASSLKKRS
jgi:predicted RNA binding protein YcfA (HicA-like mRNA interferase family)